jgi:glycosyltransferase involved in cell wall biosynthesis
MRIAIIGDFELSENYPNTKYFIEALGKDSRFEVLRCSGRVGKDRRLYESTRSIFGSLLNLIKIMLNALNAAITIRRYSNETCDVIYLPYPAVFVAFFAAFLARRGSSSPPIVMDSFISVYDTAVFDREMLKPGGLLAKLLRYIERTAISRADYVITDTVSNAKHMSHLFDADLRKYKAINLCINETLFQPQEADAREAMRVLFVGSFVPLQGAEVVAEAAVILGQRKDIQFHIAGDGQTSSQVAELLKGQEVNLNWQRRWHSITEISELYASADVCLGVFGLTAKARRVLPYKVYMALACGKPVVSLRPDGDVIVAQEPPFVAVDEVSGEALAEELIKLAESESERMRYGKAGRHYYESYLSNSQALDSFYKFIQEL